MRTLLASIGRQLRRILLGERRAIPRTPEARQIIHRQAALAAEVRRRGIRDGAMRAQHRIGQ